MGKVKWGFALILAFFLLGILSTAAFAKDPYGLEPLQVPGTLDLQVNFTINPDTDSDATIFDLHVYDNTGKEITGSPFQNITVLSGKGSQIISGLTPEAVYKIQLTYAGSNVVLSTSSDVINNSNNAPLYNLKDNPGKVDQIGNGLENANLTGHNSTNKSRYNQKVHGFYQNNTNSCASCHQTHTGSDSRSTKDQTLLFKDGVYSTCSACHDGTTGAYNTFKSLTSSTPNSISGTFNVADDTAHGSLHQADGSLNITAAPGGNNDSKDSLWNQEFNCASCHAPHGSGSNEENNLNIDPLGWGGVAYSALPSGVTIQTATSSQKDALSGKLFNNIPIYNKGNIPNSEDTPYILVRISNVSATDISGNYFWNRAKVAVGSDIIQTYRWDGLEYTPDYSLWLQELGYPFKANTALFNDSYPLDANGNLTYDAKGNLIKPSKDITRNSGMNVVWRDAFAWGTGLNDSAAALYVKSAQLSLGIDVETTSNIMSLFDKNAKGIDSSGKSIAYIPDSGVEMAKYCAACHTDYITDPATGEPGILAGYNRHTTHISTVNGQQVTFEGVSDELTCVRCHFAHGTKNAIMKDANSGDNATTSTDTLSGSNHSSALRRYINMDSCYTSGCHTKDPSDNSMYLDWSY